MVEKIISAILITISAAIPFLLLIVVLFRDYLPLFGVSPTNFHTVAMQLAALFMLITALQKSSLTKSWRIFCISCSFVILIEAIIMQFI